jgi:glutamate synthase (ferredoxin)
MTGGIAYFLDQDGRLLERMSGEPLAKQRVNYCSWRTPTQGSNSGTCDRTGSAKAKQILENWSEYLPQFWQIVPPSEQDSPEASDKVDKVEVAAAQH